MGGVGTVEARRNAQTRRCGHPARPPRRSRSWRFPRMYCPTPGCRRNRTWRGRAASPEHSGHVRGSVGADRQPLDEIVVEADIWIERQPVRAFPLQDAVRVVLAQERVAVTVAGTVVPARRRPVGRERHTPCVIVVRSSADVRLNQCQSEKRDLHEQQTDTKHNLLRIDSLLNETFRTMAPMVSNTCSADLAAVCLGSATVYMDGLAEMESGLPWTKGTRDKHHGGVTTPEVETQLMCGQARTADRPSRRHDGAVPGNRDRFRAAIRRSRSLTARLPSLTRCRTA